jgi:hypothetical protein
LVQIAKKSEIDNLLGIRCDREQQAGSDRNAADQAHGEALSPDRNLPVLSQVRDQSPRRRRAAKPTRIAGHGIASFMRYCCGSTSRALA